MTQPERTHAHLTHGSHRPELEDQLVGNEAGLRNLIRACERALEDGDCQAIDLGEFSGVVKKESSWFTEQHHDTGSSWGCYLALALGAGALVLMGMGALQVFHWLMD